MRKLIQQLCAFLDDGEDLVLITVSSRSGSTPRLAGAKMIVRRNGGIVGTIGGGLVEGLAIEEANHCFSDGRSLRRSFELTNDDAAITDMICGGQLQLLLEFIRANEDNRMVFNFLKSAMVSGRRAALVCPIDADNGSDRFVIDHMGRTSHDNVPEQLLATIREIRFLTSGSSLIEHSGREYLVSDFAVGGNLILIGAGHVAACTAETASRVGFRVTVMDDRGDFATRKRFPLADQIKVLHSFTDCFKEYNIDQDCYLVIVTRGHRHDMEVLDQALRTQAGYIGMIGSRKKRDAIYSNLVNKGVKKEQLQKVHCPIGMAIKADTPEEIAVSIVAELIAQRATGRKAWHLV